MSGNTKPAGDDKKRRSAKGKNTFTTKSGAAIKLHRSLGERIKASREARARRKAAYLATLPKNPFKRFLYRLKPRELARYWFSRDGALMALKIFGATIIICFVFIVGVFAYFRKDLPNIKDLSVQNLGGSVSYYDRTGDILLWQDYVDIKRIPVPADQMSKHIRNATVAVEDKDFYKHGAFDMRGIVRAALNNVFGGSTQGGSTISMQLAKISQNNTYERTFANKIKELILSIEMEREYSKDDILTGYLNAVPYGPLSVGVQVAAQDYFGVDAKDLTIAQSAFLAAIPKSPSVYSPHGPYFDAEALIARMHYIIDLMYEQKMITKEEAEEAKSVDILATVKEKQPSKYTNIKAPSFVQAAKDELLERYSDEVVKQGGWKVITTLDMNLQDLAQKAVNDGMAQVRRQTPGGNCRDNRGLPCRDGATAAFVAIDNETGQVVALVGNGDHDIVTNKEIGELNFGSQLFVSPGSTFKPYDYAVFIENNNAGAGSVLYDNRAPLPGYPCTSDNNCLRDYDRVYPGPLTLRYALGGSRNVPAVKAMLAAIPDDQSPGRVASINKTIGTAEAMMGVNNKEKKKYWCFYPGTDVFTASNNNKYREENQSQCGASSAIGDGAYLHLDDHAAGLSTFARMGYQIPHTYILEIKDSANKTVYKWEQPKPKQILRPDTAYIINDMLADSRASYLGSAFHNYKGWKFAIKTGTTNDSFDGLMASWSTKYTAVTWVGHYTRTIAMTGFMETMTRPIMRAWMQAAHDNLQPVNWERPSGVKTLPAFVITNKIGSSAARVPSPDTDIYPSWFQPVDGSGGNSDTVIDLVSQKTATECTPELARSTTSGSGSNANIHSRDPFAGMPGSPNQTSDSVDDVHNCNDAKPGITMQDSVTCEIGDECEINIFVSRGTHPLMGGSYATAPAGTVSITLNGQTRTKEIEDPDSWNWWPVDLDDFHVTEPGHYTMQVTVVDSVLYSFTKTVQVTFTN